MTYREAGFNIFLHRGKTSENDFPISEDVISNLIPEISGSAIAGGISRSSNGAIEINWEEGTMRLSNLDKNEIEISGEKMVFYDSGLVRIFIGETE